MLVGFLTSLSITTLSIGGPLAAAYIIAQNWEREQMRAALAFYFLCTYIVAFGLYYATGLVDRDTLVNIGLLIPSLVVGFGIGAFLARRMNTAVFRYVAIGGDNHRQRRAAGPGGAESAGGFDGLRAGPYWLNRRGLG